MSIAFYVVNKLQAKLLMYEKTDLNNPEAKVSRQVLICINTGHMVDRPKSK